MRKYLIEKYNVRRSLSLKVYHIKSATGHMFVRALSYCNCTALLGAAPNLILRRTQLVHRKGNRFDSDCPETLPLVTLIIYQHRLLNANWQGYYDLVACVTGVRKARERGFGALINMAKGARAKRRAPPSLPSSLLAHPPQFKSYSSLYTSISCYYLRSTKSFRKTRGKNVNND